MNFGASYILYLREHWLSALVFVLFAALFYMGWKKGLVKMAFSFVSLLFSVILSKILLPVVKPWALSNPVIVGLIRARIPVQTLVPGASTDPGTAASGNAAQGAAGSIGNTITDSFYRWAGLDKFTNYLADRITNLILSILIFIVLVILIHLGSKLLYHVLEGVAKLPGISLLNRLMGGALGLLEGVAYLWILFLIIGILPSFPFSEEILHQINREGSWLYLLKEANLLTRVFSALL